LGRGSSFTADAASQYICNLATVPQPFLETNAQAFINDEGLSVFGFGAFRDQAGVHFTTQVPEDLRPDVIAHEFAHVYIDDNYTHFISNGFDSPALRESLPDIIGIAVETEIGQEADIWDFGMNAQGDPHRSLNEPILPHNHPFYEDLPLHTRSLTLSHWFFLLVTQSDCFQGTINQRISDALEFLLVCVGNTAPSGLPVNNFTTMREASIRDMYEAQGNQCTQCYIDLINAWHAVGVGEPYINFPEIPDEVMVQTGPCSVNISWEDQGVPSYLWTLQGLTNNGQFVTDQGILNNTTSFNIDGLDPGNYTVNFELSCDGTPDPNNNNFAQQFVISGLDPV